MKTPHPENLRAHLATAEKRGALATFYPKLISGIRKGAPVALRWETFDTNHRTISVSKQATKDEAGNLVVTGPKTENSIRQIFISQEAVDLLVREHAKHPDNSWLFPFSQTRAMYHPDSVATLHQRILKDAGLGHSTFTTCTIPLPPWPSRTTWTSRPYPPCWALRRRVHTVSLHPHHPPKAGRSPPGHGQSHGASAVRNAVRAKKITQRTRREAGLPCRYAAFFRQCGSRCGAGRRYVTKGLLYWFSSQEVGENRLRHVSTSMSYSARPAKAFHGTVCTFQQLCTIILLVSLPTVGAHLFPSRSLQKMDSMCH